MSGYEKIKPEMGYKSGDNSIIRRSVYQFYFILLFITSQQPKRANCVDSVVFYM